MQVFVSESHRPEKKTYIYWNQPRPNWILSFKSNKRSIILQEQEGAFIHLESCINVVELDSDKVVFWCVLG